MIYFVQCGKGGPIKIGHSTNPRKRLRQLQNGSPYELRLLGVLAGNLEKEAELHKQFSEWRLREEWFIPVSQLLNFIAKNAKELKPVPIRHKIFPISLEERARRWRRAKAGLSFRA
jgi:hypothetical protein